MEGEKKYVVNSQSPPHNFSQDVLKLPPGVPHQTLNLFNKFYTAASQMLGFVVDNGKVGGFLMRQNRTNTRETKLIRAEGHAIKRVERESGVSVRNMRNRMMDPEPCRRLQVCIFPTDPIDQARGLDIDCSPFLRLFLILSVYSLQILNSV